MNNPYEILGVSPSATDDEVKAAYRELAKKYHPDNYAGAPDIADLASEKMKEINEAYDTIVTERKNGTGSASYTSDNTSSGSAGASYGSYANPGYQNTYSTVTDFADVRRLISQERFTDAEQLLDGVPSERRNAEWNFLKGVVSYRRGWLEQAYAYLNVAVTMDPNNAEFRAAFNQAKQMRSGKYGGYRGSGGSGCGDPCNMCCGLVCADSCCECCGGDIVSCI